MFVINFSEDLDGLTVRKPPRLHRSMAMEPNHCGISGCLDYPIGMGSCELHYECNLCIQYAKETMNITTRPVAAKDVEDGESKINP